MDHSRRGIFVTDPRWMDSPLEEIAMFRERGAPPRSRSVEFRKAIRRRT